MPLLAKFKTILLLEHTAILTLQRYYLFMQFKMQYKKVGVTEVVIALLTVKPKINSVS